MRKNGKIDSWSNNRWNDLPCQRLYRWFLRLTSCYYTAVQMIKKKTFLLRKSHRTYSSWQGRYLTEVRQMSWFLELLIDDYNAKVQKVNEFQLLQILNDLSIKHLIKLILYENDVKLLKFKRSLV